MAPTIVKGPPNLLPSAKELDTALRNQTELPVLRLPPEIRNYIYDFALDLKSDQLHHDNHHDWNRFNLSYMCRQLYAETAELYFTVKILPLIRGGASFATIREMVSTIEAFSSAQRNAITKVKLPAAATEGKSRAGVQCPFGALLSLKKLLITHDMNVAHRSWVSRSGFRVLGMIEWMRQFTVDIDYIALPAENDQPDSL
ncbi:hypothetical protein CC86DRAFT_401839 [Ophiobolus disseminans]|uniref:F-box domain-containing protein n=1 Tax=Ophiobolus disseminans TaxID=1469910 RepID=A0A6A7AF00_9PLEO|nr:hypothetical protein CC86DRAFT_401839 [Ophiobolus disseminans]